MDLDERLRIAKANVDDSRHRSCLRCNCEQCSWMRVLGHRTTLGHYVCRQLYDADDFCSACSRERNRAAN